MEAEVGKDAPALQIKKKKDNKDSSLNADVMPGVATARVRL